MISHKNLSVKTIIGAMQPYQTMLKPRENEVLIALMGGSTTYAEIGHVMGISCRTVQTYLASIYKTLGVRNRTQLVLWCVCNGYAVEQTKCAVGYPTRSL